jgi:hypothetical protein
MKKRIAVLSFLLLYLSTTAGFAMNLHFCGNSLSGIQLNSPVKKTCCKKEAKSKPDKCCKDKHILIKVSDQQYAAADFKIPSATDLDLFLLPHLSLNFNIIYDVLSFAPQYRGPPDLAAVSLTIKNCVFRI